MEVLKSYYEISPFFFIITCSASVLYLTMNLIMIIGGIDGVDDIIGHDSHDHLSSEAVFKFFSVQSILAFFMGFGWAGITSTVNWQLQFWLALVVATLAGLFLMSFSAFLLFQVKKLNNIPASVNLYSAIGSKGTVYTNIPVSTDGEGKVQIVVSGALRIVSAISTEEHIESFTEIEVVGVKDKTTLIVKKILKDTPPGENT